MNLSHLVTEAHILEALGVVIMLLSVHLIVNWRKRLGEARADDLALAGLPAVSESGDEYARELREAASSVRAATSPLKSAPGTRSQLPSEEARTNQFAALRDDRPAPAARRTTGPMSRPRQAVQEYDDYITGEIVAVRPASDTTETHAVIMRLMEDFRTEWHWVAGELHPPTALTDSLHEDDWLHRLLTEPEMAAV